MDSRVFRDADSESGLKTKKGMSLAAENHRYHLLNSMKTQKQPKNFKKNPGGKFPPMGVFLKLLKKITRGGVNSPPRGVNFHPGGANLPPRGANLVLAWTEKFQKIEKKNFQFFFIFRNPLLTFLSDFRFCYVS